MARDLSKYSKLSDFQEIIDNNQIKSPSEFQKFDGSLYKKAQILNLHKLLKFEKRRICNRVNDWKNISTLEDFQKFIAYNNIQSSSEFRVKYNTLYQKAIRLKIKNQLIFNKTKFWRSLEAYEELADFQKFIEDNKILSPTEFKHFDFALYRKACHKGFANNLIYVSRKMSFGEIYIQKFLDQNNIKYSFQKKFDWLKDKTHLYLDFYLPEYKVGIEVQGKQHFIQNDYFGGATIFNEDCKRDKLKYDLCKNNGINIIYFVNTINENFSNVNFDKYWGTIYTDSMEILNFIYNNKNN